jgi:hypothetical protein
MYNVTKHKTISNRIGWGKPQVDGFAITLDEAIEMVQ